MPDDPRPPDELLPFTDEDDNDRSDRGPVGPDQFLYIGKGLTASEFSDYVRSYNFGSMPPDFVVLHHTAIPGTRHARYGAAAAWDDGEAGLSDAQVYAQRAGKLGGIKEYYRAQLGWDRGPHLFIDDRYIWLFTPMYHAGIHARQGNEYRTADGGYHYSVGIEVVGYYEHTVWPEPVAELVGHAVAALRRQLGTFELRHQRFAGGISSHRDYNKPQCPGRAISEAYYIDVISRAWHRLHSEA